MKQEKGKSDSSLDKIILIILFIVVMLVMWWLFSSSQTKGEKVPASVFSHHVVDPSTVSVEYRVTNTTDSPGKSSCEIAMHDASKKYSGSDFDFKSAKEIQPGEEYSGVAQLNISNDGAKFVNNSKITCTIEP